MKCSSLKPGDILVVLFDLHSSGLIKEHHQIEILLISLVL